MVFPWSQQSSARIVTHATTIEVGLFGLEILLTVANQPCAGLRQGRRPMNDVIKAEIFYDGEQYRAKCPQLGVCISGVTLDDLIKDLEETVSSHVERDPPGPLYCVYRFLKR